MNNIPPEILENILENIRRTEGTVAFEYTSRDAFATDPTEGVFLEIVAGAHLFRLERGRPRVLRFFHASPGTGTRVATIDLSSAPEFDKAFLLFGWSPTEIKFWCGPRVPDGEQLLTADGVPSPRQFQIGTDGSVLQMGDQGVDVMGMHVYEGGKPIVLPSAIQAWENTATAIRILRTGQSGEGFSYEVVVSSLTLVMLVTGFEAYTKTRLSELEMEGISPNSRALFDSFSSKGRRVSGEYSEMEETATSSGVSILKQIIERGSINFQNYEDVKKAFSRAYDISLATIGIESGEVESLRKYVRYRHRIVHVSPLLGVLNLAEVPPEAPVFANRALADAALGCFDSVVKKLHAATLALRRKD
jgi:hypothetical protein